MINRELASHSPELAEKMQLAVITKLDLPDVRERLPAALAFFAARGLRVFPISSATGEGVQELINAVAIEIEARRAERKTPAPAEPLV
jgi:GTP-binding protein